MLFICGCIFCLNYLNVTLSEVPMNVGKEKYGLERVFVVRIVLFRFYVTLDFYY